MVAVNRAFEMLHRILVEEAGAAPIASEVDESREFSGDTSNASAYLWMVRHLLLGIALDEWAIEEAIVYFEQLVPVQATRATEEPEDPERPWFFLGTVRTGNTGMHARSLRAGVQTYHAALRRWACRRCKPAHS